MKRILVILFVAMLSPAILFAGPNKPDIVVITQNQYLGADLTPIIAASDPLEYAAAVLGALDSIAANNIPERAEALAASIIERDAHMVGLQEVFAFDCVDPLGTGACPWFAAAMNDHLQLTLDALTDQGGDYHVAAVVNNLVIPSGDFSFPGLPVPVSETESVFITVLDRDVILARGDVSTTPVEFPCFGGEDYESAHGCNFVNVADAPLLTGDTVLIQRGFVGVDFSIAENDYRLVNTHLEVRYPAPVQDARIIQAAQAAELIGTVLAVHPAERELLVVGDINSAPEDEPVDTSFGTAFPPYLQFSQFFTDVWNLRPGKPKGRTCCEDADLSNPSSQHYERIDVIFSLNPPSRVKANVLNNDPSDKTPSGLWPSDHASVVGRLWFD